MLDRIQQSSECSFLFQCPNVAIHHQRRSDLRGRSGCAMRQIDSPISFELMFRPYRRKEIQSSWPTFLIDQATLIRGFRFQKISNRLERLWRDFVIIGKNHSESFREPRTNRNLVHAIEALLGKVILVCDHSAWWEINLALNHLVYLHGLVVPVSAALPSAFGKTFWILIAAKPAVNDLCS